MVVITVCIALSFSVRHGKHQLCLGGCQEGWCVFTLVLLALISSALTKKSSLFTCAQALTLVATEGVSKPPEAADPALRNTENHVSVVVYCGAALCDQRHVTLLPPPVSVFLLELSVCIGL